MHLPRHFALVACLLLGCESASTLDAGADARALDAPGLDAALPPGADAPGLDAFGADAARATSCGDPESLLPRWYTSFAPTRRVHVATDGDDARDGLTAATALRTPAAAFRIATPGTEIAFAPGMYRGMCPYFEDLRGEESAPIVLRSSGGPRAAQFDCERAGGWMLVRPRYVAFDGLEIFGSPNDGHVLNMASGAAPVTTLAEHVVVHRSYLHDAGRHAIKFSQAQNITLVGNEFANSRTRDLLISFVAVDDVIVAGNYGHDAGSFNQIKGGSRRSTWYRNRVERTEQGILVGGDCTGSQFLVHADANAEAQDVRVWDNVLTETSRAFRFVSCHNCEVAHNTWYSSAPNQAMFMLNTGFDCGGPSEVPLRNENITVRNNIFAATRPFVYVIAGQMPAGLTMDHNLWWAGGDPSATGTDVPFAGEASSLYGMDPGFAGAPMDLQLSAMSPARGRGVSVPWAVGNAAGACWSSPPNMGAF
jgi:hypothetical protein